MSGDPPNDSITENGQNTQKSPGDLRRLAVTQTPVKKKSSNSRVKNSIGVNNNNNNNNNGRFKGLINNISHKKTWTWLRKRNLKRETVSLQIAAQDSAIRTNHIKARIDKTQKNSKS